MNPKDRMADLGLDLLDRIRMRSENWIEFWVVQKAVNFLTS
jgi:hypothetical protein